MTKRGRLRTIVDRTYHLFGPLLTFLFIPILLIFIILELDTQLLYQCGSGMQLPNINSGTMQIIPPPAPSWYQDIALGTILMQFGGLLLLITFIMSLVYFVIGIVHYGSARFGQKEKNKGNLKFFILRGLLGMMLTFLLYTLIILKLTLSPVCL